MQLPNAEGGMLYLMIPLQGATLAALGYVVRVAIKVSRAYNEHRLMWFEYATRHGLPVDADLQLASRARASAAGN
jgi:hypothetical protein